MFYNVLYIIIVCKIHKGSAGWTTVRCASGNGNDSQAQRGAVVVSLMWLVAPVPLTTEGAGAYQFHPFTHHQR